MDKRYVIDRIRSDLRREIYELMTYPAYHSLEKELTEGLLHAHPLYSSLHQFSTDRSVPAGEKEEKKQLFAYLIYREMNQRLGGFHFDRYKSLSSGPAQDKLLAELFESLDFSEFLDNYSCFSDYLSTSEYVEFAETRQFRFLEDVITSSIKKNKVIPAVGRAIALDIADSLHLTEDYGYLRLSDETREERYIYNDEKIGNYVLFRKVSVLFEAQTSTVLLKRSNRTSNEFSYLLTDFGALIKGMD